MLSYLKRAAADNVQYAEIFFDPQTHTQRGIPFKTVISGLYRATVDGQIWMGIKGRIIMSFLRHLSEDEALKTLEEAKPYLDIIVAIDLDSGEQGNPPNKFSRVFKQAAELGLKLTAHAGEEGGPDYIVQALNQKALRINHGIRCLEDDSVVQRLKNDEIPLTVCPLSNKKLQVFNRYFKGKNVTKELLSKGLKVTINSDDPAYFGGYISDNFLDTALDLCLNEDDIFQICCNAFTATFLPPQDKEMYLSLLRRHRWEMGCAPPPKSIVVFGSRSLKAGTEEYQFAYDVSKLFANEGYTVINGGYNGIMMASSHGGSDGQGKVRGVIAPTVFPQRNLLGNKFLTEVSVAHSLPERISKLVMDSQIFVVCPGTIGTFSELLLAWNLSSLKPISGAVPPRVFLTRNPWGRVVHDLHQALNIPNDDVKLLTFVDRPEEVLAEVKKMVHI